MERRISAVGGQHERLTWRAGVVLIVVCLLLGMAGSGWAAKWPKIPQSELTLTEVADYPGSPAVLLYEKGVLTYEGTAALSSSLEVYRRIKVLTEEGVEYGSISLRTSTEYRLGDLEARTHTPDGRIVPLPADAVFKSEYSTYYSSTVNTFAMPEVTVGAIIEYSYVIRFDNPLYTYTWYFQGEIPTLYSEIECFVPDRYTFRPLAKSALKDQQVFNDMKKTGKGMKVTYRMENVPPVADEPDRVAFADLASHVVFLPHTYTGRTSKMALLESWKSTIKLVQSDGSSGYSGFRIQDASAAAKTRELVTGIDSDLDKAKALFRFVRDEIITERYTGIGVGDKTANEIFDKGRGDFAEKALLLQVMLSNAGIDSSIGWTNPLDINSVDTEVPVPTRLDTVLTVTEIDGTRYFLDTSDRSLGFGMLEPDLEGVPCLLVDRKEPEWVTTPLTPSDKSYRHVSLELEIDDAGSVSGTGKLEAAGHQGWRYLGWKDTRDETLAAWESWLQDAFPGYDISELELEEQIEERAVGLTWAMTQRPEEVLGDEVTLHPSAPLTIATNPYSLEPEQRQTPGRLWDASTHTVDLVLRWPEGWIIDSKPPERFYRCYAGHIKCVVEVDRDNRELHSTRELQYLKRDFASANDYRILRNLLKTTVANDAATLVLILE